MIEKQKEQGKILVKVLKAAGSETNHCLKLQKQSGVCKGECMCERERDESKAAG